MEGGMPRGPRSLKSSEVQGRCVTSSSSCAEKVSLRRAIHCVRFSSVNWPREGARRCEHDVLEDRPYHIARSRVGRLCWLWSVSVSFLISTGIDLVGTERGEEKRRARVEKGNLEEKRFVNTSKS